MSPAGEEQPHPPPLHWVVVCPRHGERATLSIVELTQDPPQVMGCSLRDGELPPGCGRACRERLTFRPQPRTEQ